MNKIKTSPKLELVLIPIKQLQESKTNPRTHYNEKELQELAESIKQGGILQPIIIRELKKNSYEIVCGFRRYKASKIAGLSEIPSIIRTLTDDEAMEFQVIENLHREDVHPMEEATGYQQLLNSGKYTVEALSEKIGKSTTYIYSRLRLNHLIDKFQKLFAKEWLSYAVVRVICRHTKEFQEKIYDEFTNDNMYLGFKDANNDEEIIKSILPSQIEEFVKDNLYKNLKYAPFDLSDKVLIKDKPCNTCKSNTACSGQLFPEYTKDKFCTDPKCYNEKVSSFVSQSEKKLQGKKEEYVKISTQYSVNDKDIIGSGQYNICKKTDKGATKAIVVDVNNYTESDQKELGKVVYITTKKESGSNSYSGPGKSLSEKINEVRGKNNKQVRFDLLCAISNQFKPEFRDKKDLPLDVKRYFLSLAFSTIDHDTASKMKNYFKWDISKYKKDNYVDYSEFFTNVFINKTLEKSFDEFIVELLWALLAGKSCSLDKYINWQDKFSDRYGGLNNDYIYELAEIYKLDYKGRLKQLNDMSIANLKEKSKPPKKNDN